MPAETATSEVPSTRVSSRRDITSLPVWVPYLLALVFGAGALRHSGEWAIADTDAARHAMNGAFLYDMVRLGRVTHPIQYGKEYYAHFPALSLPFHPPGFPAVEALFFAIFGVHVLSSRLAVALAVGICAVLLYRLTKVVLGRDAVAACVTITTLSLWISQAVATDVMLEFPALAFALAALTYLADSDRVYTLRRALLFAGFATAAVWTKQQAAFLLGVPLLFAILNRRWRRLTEKPLWISSGILAAAALGVTFIWSAFRGLSTPDANNVGLTPHALSYIWSRNLGIYGHWIASNLLWLPLIFALSGVLIYGWAVFKRCQVELGVHFYVAWILSVAGLLMVLGASSGRYLFFLLPAIITVLYAMIFRGGARLWGEKRACYVIFAFALAWFVSGLFFRPEFLHGPAQAAAIVARDEHPSRIVYAGEADGNFTFAVRTHDSKLQSTIVRGGKLPADIFAPAAFEQFCHEYGINWVVLEELSTPHDWSALVKAAPATMQLTNVIPLASNRGRWGSGTIRIYRFTAPSDHPRNALTIPNRKLGHWIEVKF